MSCITMYGRGCSRSAQSPVIAHRGYGDLWQNKRCPRNQRIPVKGRVSGGPASATLAHHSPGTEAAPVVFTAVCDEPIWTCYWRGLPPNVTHSDRNDNLTQQNFSANRSYEYFWIKLIDFHVESVYFSLRRADPQGCKDPDNFPWQFDGLNWSDEMRCLSGESKCR